MREKNKKKNKLKKILYFIFFAIVLTFFIYITNASFLRIQKIVVQEVKYTERSEIELTVKEQLEGRYFGLFSKSNALIFSRPKIANEIKKKYPSISKVDVDLKGVSTIDIQLEEYIATAIWCDIPVTPATTLIHDAEGVEKTSVIPQVVNSFRDQNCYFLNEEGIVFSPTKYDSSTEIVKTFGFIETDPLKKNFSNPKTFKDLVEFIKLLRRLNIVADQIWTTNGEVYAILTQQGVKIYIDSESDVVSIFDNLETVMKRDAINQAQLSNIDYIDLRFGNRVFYKLK